ncbi:MAG: hypothetical protein Q8O84_02250, partial [Nanoarchaeota archaeon]|nr:hypothetical protein [Nanoarchaeota archaeon]
ALSDETFEKLREACRKFLKNPSIKSFEVEKTDLEKIKENAKKKKFEFILLEAKTDKQEGDIAGSKLLKFYKCLENEIIRFFEIKEKGFNYNNKKSARFFFVVKNKGEIVLSGPKEEDKKNVLAFRKKHKHAFVKRGRLFAKEKISFSMKDFIGKWKLKNKRQIKEMSIKDLEIV